MLAVPVSTLNLPGSPGGWHPYFGRKPRGPSEGFCSAEAASARPSREGRGGAGSDGCWAATRAELSARSRRVPAHCTGAAEGQPRASREPPARSPPGMEPCGGDGQRRRLEEARTELLDSEFWNSSLRTLLRSLREVQACWKEMPVPTGEDALLALAEMQLCPSALLPGRACLRCVCYGLGNFASCVKARFQLAFLLLLLKELQIPEEWCCVFDPAFSELEREALHRLGLSVLPQNEEGKRAIAEPTVFYMIHCGKALYNNLLWSNWSAEALSKMVIIGNSFKGIEERVPSRILQTDYAYIAKILTATEEEALPPHAQYLDVFNDTAVHCFPWHKLREVPQETWNFQEEPVYHAEDQLEFIRKNDVI
uniref:SRR1-like protein n=1 Tax=Euleptes europaea TaxID=460621 RepID=UPI0025425AF9|nr:SRR1-like protein [Euleptes europaea]